MCDRSHDVPSRTHCPSSDSTNDPAVGLVRVANGTILPDSKGMWLPFSPDLKLATADGTNVLPIAQCQSSSIWLCMSMFEYVGLRQLEN